MRASARASIRACIKPIEAPSDARTHARTHPCLTRPPMQKPSTSLYSDIVPPSLVFLSSHTCFPPLIPAWGTP